MEEIKKCGNCKELKEFSEFNKCKGGTHGLHGHCRDCQKVIRKKWNLENKDREASYAKEKYSENYEKFKEKYRNDEEFKETILEKNRVRRRTEEVKAVARIQRAKWNSIPHNKIAGNLRSRIRTALKGIVEKVETTENLLGMEFEQFKAYLESKFTSGMSWDNYGVWHVDHILPCDFFDFNIKEHQLICFNYRNLQPMWGKENISKNNKIQIENVQKFIDEIKNNL